MKHLFLRKTLRRYGAALLLSFAASSLYAQSPDNSFGSDGIVTTPNTSEILAIATQPDGKILAAGYLIIDLDYHFQIARYLPDGTPDPSFGSGGMVETFINFAAAPSSIIVQPDGKILVGGSYATGDFAPFFHQVMVRYNSNGSLDNGFGDNGIVQNEISLSESLNAIVLQPDGKIITGGELYDGSNNRFLLAKYHTDGSPDNSFGTGGIVITEVGEYAGIADLALLPDGSILAAGTEGFPDDAPGQEDHLHFALAKYNNDGTSYSSFGTGGIVLTDLMPGAADELAAIALQADGKIVAGGSSGYRQAIARYLPDGTLDAAFGTSGRTVTEERPRITGLAIRSDGRIVSSGTLFTADFGADFLLMQYKANGSLDDAFGDHGSYATSIAPSGPSGSLDYAQCLTLQADGKLLAAGSANNMFALVRYDLNATPTDVDGPLKRDPFKTGPNPFRDVIFLEQAPGLQIRELQLVNMLGQTVFRTAVTPQQSSYSVPGNIVAGNYILLLRNNTGQTWKTKLTKQ